MTERKRENYSQLMCLVEENDWNLFLSTFLLHPVTTSALWGRSARALFLRWRVLLSLPLLGGFGLSLGLDSPPEGFRLGEVLLTL